MLIDLKKEKLLKILILIGLVFLVVLIFAQKINFTSIDLGRHLENGKIVWQNPAVLFTNFYSYTEPDLLFINHHWLSGLIFYGVYLVGGFSLLSFFNISLAITIFLLAFNLARKKAGFYLSALVALPVIFLLSERVEIRPEIISYLLIFLVWTIIDKTKCDQKWRRFWYFIPIFILWVNLHIYFFIGLALIGFQVLAEFLLFFAKNNQNLIERFKLSLINIKPWLIAFVISVLACLANPNTWRGLLYPFNIFQNYGYEIVENKSIFYLEHLFINPNFLIFKLLLFILFLSWLGYFLYIKKIRLFDFFISLFFSFLAIFASRNLALFALVVLVLIPTNLSIFNYLLNKKNLKLYLSSFLLIVIFSSGAYLLIKNYSNQSIGLNLATGSADSIKFFKDNNLSGPIFNNYDLGSALIFWLYPQEKVFVDNRPEAYGNHFFADIYKPLQNDSVKWDEYSKLYQFKTIYFSHTDGTPWAHKFITRILTDQNWTLVYFDRTTLILLNKKLYPATVINALAINEATFFSNLRDLATNSNESGKFSLASLAEKANQRDLAREIYQQVLFSNPDNKQATVSLGYLYSNSNNFQDLSYALEYLQKALKDGYKLPAVYNQIALINWNLGKYQKAESAWNSALKLDRTNISALYYLNQVNDLKKEGKLPLTFSSTTY